MQLRGHEGRTLTVAFVTCSWTGAGDHAALSASADVTLRLWDLCTGAEVRCLEYANPPDPATADVAISPDGRRVLTALWTGEISLRDYASGEEIRRLKGHTSCQTAAVRYLVRATFSLLPGTTLYACGTWKPGRNCVASRGTRTRSGIPT